MLAWLANCRRRCSLDCCLLCSSSKAWSRFGTSCCTCGGEREGVGRAGGDDKPSPGLRGQRGFLGEKKWLRRPTALQAQGEAPSRGGSGSYSPADDPFVKICRPRRGRSPRALREVGAYPFPLGVDDLGGDGGVGVVPGEFDAVEVGDALGFPLDAQDGLALLVGVRQGGLELVVSGDEPLRGTGDASGARRRFQERFF